MGRGPEAPVRVGCMGRRSPGRSGGRGAPTPAPCGRGRWKIGWPGTGRPGAGRIVPAGAPVCAVGARGAGAELCTRGAARSAEQSCAAQAAAADRGGRWRSGTRRSGCSRRRRRSSNRRRCGNGWRQRSEPQGGTAGRGGCGAAAGGAGADDGTAGFSHRHRYSGGRGTGAEPAVQPELVRQRGGHWLLRPEAQPAWHDRGAGADVPAAPPAASFG